jgi:sialate O-acetylesterase
MECGETTIGKLLRRGNVIGTILVCCATAAAAELRLPAVVSDNMVLQRGQSAPIWGWAEPGEAVTVTIAGAAAKAQADERGRWQVRLSALEPQDQALEMVVRGSSGGVLRVKNVVVGEVWLCSGPSNLFWPVKQCDHAKEEIASATYPKIRFFTVRRRMADTPQSDCEGRWVECSPASVPEVSGVGYFFARQLHVDLKIPVGLVQSFWGGSRIEAWTSMEALQADPALRPVLDYWTPQLTTFDAVRAKADYEKALTAWQEAAAQAKAAGTRPPDRPEAPADPRTSNHRPACLYNGMIEPLIPYGIRGAITYQGLGNLFWAEHSRALLETMIADWRRRWGQGDFPVGMVQPAPYTCQGWAQSSPDAYAIQRESQLLVLQKVPHTGLALTMDINAINSLHFPQKQPVARRLALWALGAVYGRAGAYQGPIYRSMSVEGDRIRICFRHVQGGLRTSDGKPPACFTIAGPDKVFQPATAKIEADTVVVQSDRVRRPVAVRFAWGNTDVPNLSNGEGFPASLFRTDAPP